MLPSRSIRKLVLNKDCKLEKKTIIDMYNELNEYLGFIERALDMRDSEIAILKGDIETFELD